MSYTFTSHDFGAHTFLVTLAATGPQTIKAAGVLNSATISGIAETDVTPAPVLTQLLVKTPEEATVNVPTYVTIEALDQSGHVMTDFTGQIALSSSITATGSPNHHTAAASLPIDYTFTTADHGEHTFQVTFTATGTSVTVTASSTSPAVTGTGQVNVYTAATVTHFGVFTSLVATPGSPVRVFVEALNASDQVVTGYTGTITLTSSDSPPRAPPARTRPPPPCRSRTSFCPATMARTSSGSHLPPPATKRSPPPIRRRPRAPAWPMSGYRAAHGTGILSQGGAAWRHPPLTWGARFPRLFPRSAAHHILTSTCVGTYSGPLGLGSPHKSAAAMNRSLLCVAAAMCLINPVHGSEPAKGPLGFETHVRPILKANCFECHGEGKKLKGGLDLRLKHLWSREASQARPFVGQTGRQPPSALPQPGDAAGQEEADRSRKWP